MHELPANNRKRSSELFATARQYMPGGVNSPVRAFGSVLGDPVFMERGEGPYLFDADGNRYIDHCCSWGPLILGHGHPAVTGAIERAVRNGASFGTPTRLENELAALVVDNHRYVDMVRFVSSGTEAVMSALRLARGATGRDKIIKFEGCYHGHVDSLLVKAGSGLATFGTSSSAGVPAGFARETIVVPLNDEAAVNQAFEAHAGQIAAVIIEPVPANNGLLIQPMHFLEFLRNTCDRHGALLIFDEVISGFRVDFEGASALYHVRADIYTFGKVIGGGMPVGAYAARRELMEQVSPLGPVYQAGTLSGNPVAMAAGKAQLTECLADGFYKSLAQRTQHFTEDLNAFLEGRGYPVRLFHVGSIFWVSFSRERHVDRADKINPSGMDGFKRFHYDLLGRGVYLGPSGYEVGFVSAAHSAAVLEESAAAMKQSFDAVFANAPAN